VANQLMLLERDEIGVKSEIASLQSNIKMMEDYNIRYHDMQNDVTNDEKEMSTLSTSLMHHQWVERNLRKIKLQEYNSAIDRLNQLIADQLLVLWGPNIKAEFVTAQAKASGKGVKQGIDLIVTVNDKGSIPIGMYSGGERKLIIIAVFRAIRLLMNVRGCGINLAIMDELDTNIDSVNCDRVVEAFEQLISDSPTSLIISHHTRLIDTMKFDEHWQVTKENEMSRITMENNQNGRF
jgi:DNA repair exonuclease SbcCD ATPase subunit